MTSIDAPPVGRRLSAAILAACLFVAPVALAACQDEQGRIADCVAAFRDAEPRALPPYQATALDDAVRSCRSYDAWLQAWDQVPGAHQDSTDAAGFLEERCAIEDLASTALCRDFADS